MRKIMPIFLCLLCTAALLNGCSKPVQEQSDTSNDMPPDSHDTVQLEQSDNVMSEDMIDTTQFSSVIPQEQVQEQIPDNTDQQAAAKEDNWANVDASDPLSTIQKNSSNPELSFSAPAYPGEEGAEFPIVGTDIVYDEEVYFDGYKDAVLEGVPELIKAYADIVFNFNEETEDYSETLCSMFFSKNLYEECAANFTYPVFYLTHTKSTLLGVDIKSLNLVHHDSGDYISFVAIVNTEMENDKAPLGNYSHEFRGSIFYSDGGHFFTDVELGHVFKTEGLSVYYKENTAKKRITMSGDEVFCWDLYFAEEFLKDYPYEGDEIMIQEGVPGWEKEVEELVNAEAAEDAEIEETADTVSES